MFLSLLDFAFLVCDFHQPEEDRTVFHSLYYKLCMLWPSLHKLGSRDLQKHFCLTLSSAKCKCTCMNTIPTPAGCMVFQWSVKPHLYFTSLFLVINVLLFLNILRCGLRSSVQSPGMTRTTKSSA